MTQQLAVYPLVGSELPAVPQARRTGPLDPRQPVNALLLCALRLPDSELFAHVDAQAKRRPGERKRPSRSDFAATYGPTPEALQAIAEFAAAHGLEASAPAHGNLCIDLRGPAGAFSRAFGVELALYEREGVTYRGYEGPLRLPEAIHPHVRAVLGLDTRPLPLTHAQHAASAPADVPSLARNLPTTVAFDYYDFPSGLTGAGLTVAFIESDLNIDLQGIQDFYSSLQVGPVSITLMGTPRHSPQPPFNSEAGMDLKITGSIAPGATYLVFANNQQYDSQPAGMLGSILTAVFNEQPSVDILSISLGVPESGWTSQELQSINLVFAAAAFLGITTCVASGDFGAAGNPQGAYAQNCAFPASSPYCLACGGTELVLSKQGQSTVLTGEVVWNDQTQPGQKAATGGGISRVFPVPSYQQRVSLPAPLNPDQGPGRGVPDVASNGSPTSGYQLQPNNQGGGHAFGTSAAAPMWAALVALLGEALGTPVGFLNALLYETQLSGQAPLPCTSITQGNNGVPSSDIVFTASASNPWNACCGLGSPLGNSLLRMLGG
ncbi:S53 family peptidase [Hyalangium sp.]|uniref:S53 family peptidase n=1 Tax=Hyalangium sp. TaxID=2028555 RepID=UPI002D3CF9E2|nr:S53 family peptidase [Hyalangium sp.]HYH99995.1 S53 family peptidase [Hyalangium sp.]